MIKLKFICLVALLALSGNDLHSQINPLGVENSFLQLDRQRGFVIMSGMALGSYLASEFLMDHEKSAFYQGHIGYYYGQSGVRSGQTEGDTYSVWMQNFGIEGEFSRWFSMRLEANIQEFTNSDYAAMGVGLKAYFKWTAFRREKIHPFFEYGCGVFYAFDEFPQDSSNFTFNLSYAIGFEYILNSQNKIRLDYNFLHHSNNNLFESNLGFDGNGVSISYSRFWRTK